ncbi:MAG TPA: immunoglobulin domain-containing protein, partial [Verrucomicrobiota bacterium]|nr:immunoglobulin domain-containing protein [Verrucomicrobiota bacterium]HOX64120.1 immunoglobulin domain-containing protein [Verrucomicrobiota bacterium]HPO44131.1 immunoglobulin domain-containing protein [Verrucomicrobiota bacterium]
MNTKQLLTLSTVSLAGASAALATADYGPAVDRMITGCAKWYTSGYGHKFAVVHCMEGYYLTGTSYLRRCDISVSCHYTVNGLVDYAGDAPRGEISQLVPEAYYAWHATCWNQHSLGTEHEGFVSNPAWFTEEMYQASALLHRHFADKFGFAKDRNHIVGHGEKSNGAWCAYASANLGINPYCNTHTDPGPYWNWSHYMALVQGVQNPPYFFDSGPQGWTSGNSMSGLAWTATGWPGIIYADQTGNDAWYYSPDTSYTGGGDSSFNVGVYPQSGTTANHDMQMFFRTSAENSFTADKSSPMVSYTAQNQWVRINLDVNAAWPKYFNKTITGLRLDVDNVNSSTRWIINHIVSQTSLRWRFDGNAQGWTSLNALSPVNWTDCCGWPGIIYADQTGNDPHFVSPANLNMLGGINDVLRVRVFPQGGSTANHDMQIFFATASQNQFSESKSVTLYYTAKDGWADLYFPVGQNGYWNSDYITRLRVDPDQTNHGNRWIIDLVLVEHLTTPATIPGPTIGEQPQMQTTSVGGSATLSVFPNGTAPFTYQWRRNGVNVPGATARDYTIANAQLSQAGFYDVVVSNAGGSVTSTPAQLVVSTTPFATGTGTGLQGQYFDNLDFTNPKLSRTDATINFNWGTGSPDPAIANTTYSVRWTGQVQPRYSQAYTFYTKTDDGARLWVNGELLIDKWVDQAATEWSGTLELVAGQSYALQMDYYQQGSLASAVLSWSSASEPKAVIPQTQLYVTSPPAIVSQPQSQTITAGYEATFSVGAGGAPPLFYQWRKDGVDLAGATASTLTLADVQSAQEGIYSVVITNNFGSTLSSNATLTVLNTPPTITTQPQGRTVLAGSNVTFTVTATGALPLRYQWLFNGSPLAGATQSALTRSSVTPADAGIYAVVVTNQFGAQASAEAELVVRALPEIITQPVGQTLARGASVTFSVAATGGAPLAYQWRRNGVNIGGATTSSYTKGNIQSGDVGMYSVVVSNPYGTVTSAEAPLTLTGAIAFQDNFSGCTLGQWTTAASPATELVASSEQNHTGGGGCSAK